MLIIFHMISIRVGNISADAKVRIYNEADF